MFVGLASRTPDHVPEGSTRETPPAGPNRSPAAGEPRRATSPRSGASWRSDVRQPRNDASRPARWVLRSAGLESARGRRRRRRARIARAPITGAERAWLTPGVAGIGGASLLADLGHEVPTALLPSFLTSTLGAPAAALGLIEGVADGLAGAARFAGGALADDPHRRRAAAVGGYTATAVLSGLIGVGDRASGRSACCAPAPGRRAACASRRATRCSPTSCRRGATAAPTASSGRWTTSARSAGRCSRSRSSRVVGVRAPRSCSRSSPACSRCVAILYAIRHTPKPTSRERRPLRFHVRPGPAAAGSGGLLGGVGAVRARQRRRDAADPARHRPARPRRTATTRGRDRDRRSTSPTTSAATLVSIPAGAPRRPARHGCACSRPASLRSPLAYARLRRRRDAAIRAARARRSSLAGIGIGLRRDRRARRRRRPSRPSGSAARRSACSPPSRASATSPRARRRPALHARLAELRVRLRRRRDGGRARALAVTTRGARARRRPGLIAAPSPE